jgi:hypothetical protein
MARDVALHNLGNRGLPRQPTQAVYRVPALSERYTRKMKYLWRKKHENEKTALCNRLALDDYVVCYDVWRERG